MIVAVGRSDTGEFYFGEFSFSKGASHFAKSITIDTSNIKCNYNLVQSSQLRAFWFILYVNHRKYFVHYGKNSSFRLLLIVIMVPSNGSLGITSNFCVSLNVIHVTALGSWHKAWDGHLRAIPACLLPALTSPHPSWEIHCVTCRPPGHQATGSQRSVGLDKQWDETLMCSICILAPNNYFGCQAAWLIACRSLLS